MQAHRSRLRQARVDLPRRRRGRAGIRGREDRKDKTRDGYDIAYRVHIYPTFGDRRINTITSVEVEAWLKEMRNKDSARTKKKLAASTIHGAWIAINTVFKYAHRHGLIAANPCEAVKKPRVKVEKRREFPLQPGHVAQLARLTTATLPMGCWCGSPRTPDSARAS